MESILILAILLIALAAWTMFTEYCWNGIQTSTNTIADARAERARVEIYHGIAKGIMSKYYRDLAHGRPISIEDCLDEIQEIQNIVGLTEDNHKMLLGAVRLDLMNATDYWMKRNAARFS